MGKILHLRRVFWALVTLLAGIQASGQDLVESLHLDLSDGLSQNTVSAIAEDKYGRIWIATPLGLQYYDGQKLYSVPNLDRNILHLEMRDSHIVALSTSAISRVDIHTLELAHIDFPTAHYYSARYLPEGVLLYHQSKADSLFLGYDLNPKPFPAFEDYSHIPTLFSDSILQIGNAQIIRSTRGVKLVQDDTLQISYANSATGILYSPRRGFVCAEDGLYDIKLQGSKYVVRHHFPSFRSQSALIDHHGNLWIGTADQGVFAVHRNLIENEYYNLKPEGGHNVSCWGGMIYKNETYALTGNGVKALGGNGDSQLEKATEQRNITTCFIAPESIIFGTANEGILKYHSGTLKEIYFNEFNAMDNTVLQIIKNDLGYLACTKLSFIQLDAEGEFLDSYPYASIGISGYIMSLAVHADKYIASTTKGAVHLTKDLETIAKKGHSKAQIISSSAMLGDEMLYASYGGGLCKEEGDSLSPFKFPDYNLLEIEAITDSVAWISSTNATYRFEHGRTRKYTLENGFPILENSQNGMINQGSGDIMLCGINGVFLYNDDRVSKLSSLPQIALRSQGRSTFPGQTIHLSAESEVANIEIQPVSILDKNHFSYSYEFADSLVLISGATFVDLSVQPGESELIVMVYDQSSEKSQSYTWNIVRPVPFWLTIWFKISAAFVALLLILGLVGLIRFIQTRKILRKEQADRKVNDERLRISAELHDNIGARLTHIISSLDIELYKKKENTTQLETINAFARDTMSQLRETIWAVSDRTIFFSEFAGRVEQYCIQCNSLAPAEITCQVASYTDFELNPVQTINLYRIIQEAINNAVKYANASEIATIIKQVDGSIEIMIADDGSGFDLSKRTYGTGLSGMKSRAEEAGAMFELSSVSGQGTTIRLVVPRK